jgi:hypothetical protein
MESIISECDLIKSEILNFLFFKYKLHNIFKNIYIYETPNVWKKQYLKITKKRKKTCILITFLKIYLNLNFFLNTHNDRDIFTFCPFRLNNHKLPIEYGRLNNIPRELSICHFCNTGDLGDEFHYLLKCDYFNEKRKTWIDKKKKFLNYNILKLGWFEDSDKKKPS